MSWNIVDPPLIRPLSAMKQLPYSRNDLSETNYLIVFYYLYASEVLPDKMAGFLIKTDLNLIWRRLYYLILLKMYKKRYRISLQNVQWNLEFHRKFLSELFQHNCCTSNYFPNMSGQKDPNVQVFFLFFFLFYQVFFLCTSM